MPSYYYIELQIIFLEGSILNIFPPNLIKFWQDFGFRIEEVEDRNSRLLNTDLDWKLEVRLIVIFYDNIL